MSARTVESGFFGAIGVDDPVCTLPEVTLGRSVDFAKANVAENKTYPVLPIPAGFVVTDIAVEQTKACDQDVTVTFGIASDNTVTVGGNFALTDDSTALLRSCQAAKPLVVTQTASDVYVSTAKASWTGSDAMKVVNSVKGGGEGLFSSAADMLCLIVPDGLTGDKLAAGKINVYLRGFQSFGEGVVSAPAGTEPYRAMLQTEDNVSGGPINPREKA